MSLSTVLAQKPVTSIDQVVEVMTGLEEVLSTSDGVYWFNHLYLHVTLAVRSAISQAGGFHDPVFLDRLDVVFANLYFDALAVGDGNPEAAPPAWRPLLRARSTRGLLPVQYALAGMNAHINRDLPAGIVTTFEQLGGSSPTNLDGRHDDYERVNGILETVEGQVKAESATGPLGEVDALTSPVDDQIATWSVRAARDTAWTNAQVLWTLRPTPILGRDYFDRLDRFTGFAATGLLARVAPFRT